MDRIFWRLRPLVWDGFFPRSMLAVLVVTIRALRRGAREAEVNWVTDP